MLLTDKVDENTQSIEELWKSIADFATSRVEDNSKYDNIYPLSVRKTQMITLRTLVNAIERCHNKFSK